MYLRDGILTFKLFEIIICVQGLKNKCYGDRLKILPFFHLAVSLTTDGEEKKRGDVIEVYKIVTGKENINS